MREAHVVGYEEFGRMHYEARHPRPAPPWAQSDAMTRDVCIHRLMVIARVRKTPTSPDEIKELELLATARLEWTACTRRHLADMKRVGGPLAYMVSLVYRYYRLKLRESDLAEYYGTARLRRHVNKLNSVALYLFPSACLPQRRNAVPRKNKPHHPLNTLGLPSQELEIVALHDQGMTCKQIARAIESSGSAVQRVLARHGCKPHRRLIKLEQVAQLRQQGLTNKEIAQQLGFKQSTVVAAMVRRRRMTRP